MVQQFLHSVLQRVLHLLAVVSNISLRCVVAVSGKRNLPCSAAVLITRPCQRLSRALAVVELSNPLILNGQAQIVNRKILGLGWPCEGGAIESADPVCAQSRVRGLDGSICLQRVSLTLGVEQWFTTDYATQEKWFVKHLFQTTNDCVTWFVGDVNRQFRLLSQIIVEPCQ